MASSDLSDIAVVSNVKFGVPGRCGIAADANVLSMSSEKRTLGVSLSCVAGLSTAAEDKAEEVADLPALEEGANSSSASSAIAKSTLCST